jgi:hypothetical protein
MYHTKPAHAHVTSPPGSPPHTLISCDDYAFHVSPIIMSRIGRVSTYFIYTFLSNWLQNAVQVGYFPHTELQNTYGTNSIHSPIVTPVRIQRPATQSLNSPWLPSSAHSRACCTMISEHIHDCSRAIWLRLLLACHSYRISVCATHSVTSSSTAYTPKYRPCGEGDCFHGYLLSYQLPQTYTPVPYRAPFVTGHTI